MITKIEIILIVLMLGSCRPPRQEQPRNFQLSEEMLNRCEFHTAQSEMVRDELRLYGKIAADNNRVAQVYPIAGGNVTRINVELGDLVEKGQVLAVVQSSEVADFQRQRLDAQADVALAEKNLQVAKELYAGKLNSERDVLAVEKELQKANAELRRINEVYSIYRLGDESTYNIIAPISGFVIFKDINQNEQLRSDKSGIVFSIAQIEEIWVLANVNESDISKVSVGYEARVQTISYPDRTFSGKVDRIFNAIDPSTKAMKVLIRIHNQSLLLKPEMNATVTIMFTENRKLVAVPSSSVIFDKSRNWVLIYHDRANIETREVEIYSSIGNITYILQGINEGEQVISSNSLLVYDALND